MRRPEDHGRLRLLDGSYTCFSCTSPGRICRRSRTGRGMDEPMAVRRVRRAVRAERLRWSHRLLRPGRTGGGRIGGR
ncbi:hypothetical protein STVIR_8801 [Streptomyces viridochromogenes Tue57]|uniref:Uncharacterized protein n=1 Tax=Streptomyces viridochromogenes Tue57 TaxID=1160705 RepID=L8NY79_STRVR|nr:hypothetical protein STVIR_8801 [Streptomyces viridochromogenes Tue57]